MAQKIFLDMQLFEKFVVEGKTRKEISLFFNVSVDLIEKHLKLNGWKTAKPPAHKTTEEVKKILSDKRKKWLADNPDRHPWRNKDKFQSKPSQKAKEFLSSLGVQFIEEFAPDIEGRFFSIDIAIPDKMIAIEINGNQHYERSGELKPYYQERHNLLEANGWTVYEVHYSACFALEKWADFVNQLTSAEKKVEFDYFNYQPREKRKHLCPDCSIEINRKSTKCKSCFQKSRIGVKRKEYKPRQFKNSRESFCLCGASKNKKAKQCKSCSGLSKRKADRPTKEELEALILKYPFTKIGQMFGVSDSAVRKWCKQAGITDFPSPSYRTQSFLKRKTGGS